MAAPVILHVDMDAFYASVEMLERPDLAGRPVVIGADPREGRGRGVVSTANYEARRYGIHSAMPISQAYAACPHAVFLPPSFSKYKAASEEVMAVLAEYADTLQVVGMDEAYLDISESCTWPHVPAFARSLQAAVRRATGLSCSVGAAPTKSAAKIASDLRKPHGVCAMAPEDLVRNLAPLSVSVIPGCGPKTTARLAEDGVHSIRDIHESNQESMSRFGKHGNWLWDVAHGLDQRPVQASRGPGKSRGNERTYGRDATDMARVVTDVKSLLASLIEREDRAFSTLTIKVRYADYSTLTRARTLSVPLEPGQIETQALASATVESLLEPVLDGRPIRLAGIRLSGFSSPSGQQPLSRFGITQPTRVRTVRQIDHTT